MSRAPSPSNAFVSFYSFFSFASLVQGGGGLKMAQVAPKEAEEDTQVREVTQFHYTAWPDHGVPEVDALLAFLQVPPLLLISPPLTLPRSCVPSIGPTSPLPRLPPCSSIARPALGERAPSCSSIPSCCSSRRTRTHPLRLSRCNWRSVRCATRHPSLSLSPSLPLPSPDPLVACWLSPAEGAVPLLLSGHRTFPRHGLQYSPSSP